MKYYFLTVMFLFILLSGCQTALLENSLDENEMVGTGSPEYPILPSETARSATSTPTSPQDSKATLETPTKLNDAKPSQVIDNYRPEEVLSSFCLYSTHTVEIKDQTLVPSRYERCYSQNPLGKYVRKETWWHSYEWLIPFNSFFQWVRYAPDEDWKPAPLEYHDYILINISYIIDQVRDLDGWQVSEECLDDYLLIKHYYYQGAFDDLPSNYIYIPGIEIEEYTWERGVTKNFQADIWITLEGYVVREKYQWDSTYIFSDGTTVDGIEKIYREIQDINQEIDIPIFTVPPVPSYLSNGYLGRWLEYGNITPGTWKYQIAKSPNEVFDAYYLYEDEGYRILNQEGNFQDGYILFVESNDGKQWKVEILPNKELGKGGIASTGSILLMVQR
jgi:hypothetical protein